MCEKVFDIKFRCSQVATDFHDEQETPELMSMPESLESSTGTSLQGKPPYKKRFVACTTLTGLLTQDCVYGRRL